MQLIPAVSCYDHCLKIIIIIKKLLFTYIHSFVASHAFLHPRIKPKRRVVTAGSPTSHICLYLFNYVFLSNVKA